jgi:[CysO sulfur-carrier protein]-S-L-cysteine hydrolase
VPVNQHTWPGRTREWALLASISPVRIARKLLDQIVAHAREEAPNECCGLVAGRNGDATEVHRARNAFASPFRYEVHPQDQFRITMEIEGRGEEIAAIYHSHTRSAAYPSQTDVNLAANWPDPLYLICSLAEPDAPVRAFSIRDARVEEVELTVDDG